MFCTIFHSTELVGVLGGAIGEWNLDTFGYVAYINSLFILLPLYNFYRYPDLKSKFDPYIGWLLLLISTLVFQSLAFDNKATKATLLLLGRSPVPAVEPEWFSQLHSESEIKKGLIAHADGPLKPVDVEKQYQQVT
ncbi:MAG TPA: hypothetical protein ENL00_04145, partial [Nitratifractor sp.]|nr:hypothetical protein [Nitratifractor sp.]